MIDMRNMNQMAVRDLYLHDNIDIDNVEWFGVDWGGPSPTESDTTLVDVQDAACPFSREEMTLLHSINPCQDSCSFGVDIYVLALNLLLV